MPNQSLRLIGNKAIKSLSHPYMPCSPTKPPLNKLGTEANSRLDGLPYRDTGTKNRNY